MNNAHWPFCPALLFWLRIFYGIFKTYWWDHSVSPLDLVFCNCFTALLVIRMINEPSLPVLVNKYMYSLFYKGWYHFLCLQHNWSLRNTYGGTKWMVADLSYTRTMKINPLYHLLFHLSSTLVDPNKYLFKFQVIIFER